MNRYLMGLLFVVVWLAVSGSFTIANLILGVLVATLAIGIIRNQLKGSDTYWGRVPAILSLVVLFMKELALSAWSVARIVMKPKMDLKPGIFAYPLRVTSDFEITLLANLITLTPGTLSVDVSQDRAVLYVHALDCSDVEATRQSIAQGFERKIMEAFRK